MRQETDQELRAEAERLLASVWRTLLADYGEEDFRCDQSFLSVYLIKYQGSADFLVRDAHVD